MKGSAFRSSVSSEKSGSAETDKTVGGSALGTSSESVDSNNAENADSLDSDDMNAGELTNMENTGVLVYREKFPTSTI